MNCPKCGAATRVTHTVRSFRDHIRRYRKCQTCAHTFQTRQGFEEVAEPLPSYSKEFAPMGKITPEDVRAMRAAHANGATSFECSLLCSCDITVNAAYKVITGRSWAWVK